ncbi:M20 aminoacylase family protein [Psychrobacter lutiphocae]|uniref:M20 aminoacylase family protein n=1 Tax=Psychrobacter lutiphocae TaxID=540500 RepID=UPI000374422D|nr:M20 aminoacylase family protein [Psychrobacter lutiphocae]
MNQHPLLVELEQTADKFAKIRQDIHQHPELGYEEFRTSDLVAKNLEAWGYTVTRGLGGTGVVGQLKKGDGSRTLGLRADMDALPLTELTDLPYASKYEGKMHACGHDGHTAMLLAAAEYLALHADFNGTLNLIFQPAEEGLAGAKRMIDEGLFEKFPCDAIFGIHNMPGYKPGQLCFNEQALMASGDRIDVTLHGKGGHGAMPHLANDPVVAGAAIIMGLQTIVSRNIDPLKTGVITVGEFKSGHTDNVIPDTAVLKLNVRSLDPDSHSTLLERIQEMVNHQAAAYGVTASFNFITHYPVLMNDAEQTQFAYKVAQELIGEDNTLTDIKPLTTSEDFAFFLQEVPGCYLFIGNGDETTGGPGACSIHNPNYDFDDTNIPIGAAYWVLLTQKFLV